MAAKRWHPKEGRQKFVTEIVKFGEMNKKVIVA